MFFVTGIIMVIQSRQTMASLRGLTFCWHMGQQKGHEGAVLSVPLTGRPRPTGNRIIFPRFDERIPEAFPPCLAICHFK